MDKIIPINSCEKIDELKIYEILSSTKLTDKQKAEFIKQNKSEIKEKLKEEITLSEFKELMKNRPLIRFKPFKNSFTKKGDAILLAKALGIDTKEIRNYINTIINNKFETRDIDYLKNFDKVKTYIYRHGTKNDVIAFLNFELSDAKHILEKLYKTLEDNSGGLADYFSRPIHRMDNSTLRKLYNTIDKNLKNAQAQGYIDKDTLNSTSEWALVRIYQIQNNSKIIRVLEIYNKLL